MRVLLLAPLTILPLAGCATAHEEHGPAGIPYACAEGRIARISYEQGGWFVRARAHLLYNGRAIELEAAPPTHGLRYVTGAHHQGPALVWSARGEEAWLAELGEDGATERPLARCARVRDGGEAEAEAAHH